MKLIYTREGRYYRRWVNLVLSLLLPGAAQFLSGRRAVGLSLFALYFALAAGVIAFLVHPATAYSFVNMGPFDWFLFPFRLLIAGDGLRRPIPRMRLRSWGILVAVYISIPIILVLGARTFLVPFKVPTGTMQPTIMGNRTAPDGSPILGDHIFVNKLAYRSSEPQRGDVIAFRSKGLPMIEQDTYYIKRLAGLPGETLGIDPPYLLVNEEKVTQPEIFNRIAKKEDGFSGFYPAKVPPSYPAPLASPSARITLGPDEYLVLGNNTLNSLDGRYFGPIKRRAIIGKAFYIYAPADRKRRLD